MKKRFLCLALVLVMLVGIIPFSAITAFAADPTSSQSNDVETITVTTFDELRSALSADGDATIVLGNDISVRDPEFNVCLYATNYNSDRNLIPEGARVFNYYGDSTAAKASAYDYIVDTFSIDVKGTKTLNLNGYDIFAYLHKVKYNDLSSRLYPETMVVYDATLFDIKKGATLNLDDTSEGTPGNIFFDGYMYDTIWADNFNYAWEWEYRKQLTRDIFSVSGTLNVFNGIIEAGRSKEQWIVDGVLDNTEWAFERYTTTTEIANTVGINYYSQTFGTYNGYARQQIWGSAVSVGSGGTFNAFGGIYYGRGEGYYNDHEPEDDAYNYGTDRGQDVGKWSQDYRRDEVICLLDDDANVNVYGGYFEGMGGANVFGGDVTGVVVFDGEFKNSKIDKVRCVDADATNDNKNVGVLVAQFETPMVITGSCGEIGLDESAYKDWSESGLGIKNAFVNGEARTDGEIVPVKLKDGTASIKFEWNGLSENLEKAGCKLYPVVQYYLGETKGLHPYEVVDNSAIITTPLSYDGQKSTFKFDLYLLMPNGKRANIGSHTVVVSVEKEEINRVSISLDTLVGGATPANYEGKVNTTGVSIVEEAWYEYNDGSLKKMNDSDKFVAGKQYVYGVTFAFDSGYKFNPFTTVSINGIAARKSGDYFHWTSAVMTAKAELTATTPNDKITVIKGDTVTLKVNAKGEGLTYLWQGDETVGAPSVGVNFRDNITLTCVNAGTYTYKCIVKDANGSRKTVTFTVTVIAPNMSGTVLPAEPVFNGEGFIGVEDSDNITVTKNGSIVLKPDFTFGNSGAIGEISYTWEIYDASYKKLGNITTENLVITADSEIINSKTVGTYVIMLSIKNTAGGVYESKFTGATIKVVEPESTGNLGGQIGSEQEQVIPYAMRRMSARSANNFEGTIVYLVKDEAIVYVTEANAQGYYMFTNIPYGSYSVKVEKEGYENYSKDVEVNQADNDCDITIIKHVCFADEGNEMSIPAKQPNCEMGELGNIECRGCISCGKFYDMEGNLIADSAADPGSLNDMGIPYAALLYPVHDYCGEAQEGGNADQYLRHRAETCLEETTYWYYCINGNCKKSAGDDPSAVDKYYVGSASNQTHIFTKQIAEDYYHYDFHELGVDGKENCKQKIWYYHACEYCGAKGNTVWESDTYGAHDYSDFRAYQPEIHTATELKGAVAQHHFCHICDTYLSGSLETTLEALTSTAPTHSYTNEYGYQGADGHANTCSCGAKDTVVPHTHGAAATETEPQICTVCQYVIAPATGHIHTSHLTKVTANSASCTVNGNIEYYTCSCGKWFTDNTATTEITNKDSVVIKAAHVYGTLIPQDNGTHTATELKDGMKAHYFCDVCDTYFDSGKNATTKAALTITNAHSYATEYGYKGADGHANTCSCGAKDTVEGHTPDRTAATETQPIKCTKCQYVIATELGHVHTNHLTKVSANSASCTADGNIEYYTCSCGKWFADATATTEITNKDSVKLPAGHTYGDIIPQDNGTHTATELKDGMKAHYFCDVCDTYFDSGKNATTKAALTITNAHSYATEYGYKGADGHANTCSCGAKDTVEGHTPDRTAATETQPIKCTKCQYVIATELGHVHTNHLTKVSANSASCTADGNIEYYTCSCGKWFADATATTDITNKDSVVIKAAHNFDNLIPAQDAVHTATELKGAVAAHYHCSCGAYFNEGKEATTLEALTGAVPTHTYVDGKCACGATDPNYQPPHEHNFVEGKCECGETDPNYVPGNDDPQTPDDNDGLGTGAIVGIVVGSVLVVGVGGFALVWFVIKKKTWAEFLAIFKKG